MMPGFIQQWILQAPTILLYPHNSAAYDAVSTISNFVQCYNTPAADNSLAILLAPTFWNITSALVSHQ